MPLRAKHVSAALSEVNSGLETEDKEVQLSALQAAFGELTRDTTPREEEYTEALEKYWETRERIAEGDKAQRENALVQFRDALLEFDVQLGFDGF